MLGLTMSDIREVTEWHDAAEGTFTVAGERIQDAINDIIEAMGISRVLYAIVIAADVRLSRRR